MWTFIHSGKLKTQVSMNYFLLKTETFMITYFKAHNVEEFRITSLPW